MRSCPFCQAINRDEAAVCYHCGNVFPYATVPVDAAPTQPVKRYRQPYGQLSYKGQPAYDNQSPYWQPAYPPPAYLPPAPMEYRGLTWKLLIAGLSLLLIIACGFSVFTLIIVTRNGVAGLGAQVFGGAVSDTPTPWPTDTAVPTDPPQRTPTPNPTQASITNKLLSPECKGSLDQLSKVSDQIKNDPLKVLDDTWRKDVDLAIADMKTYCGTLDSASPIPGELGQVQTSMNQATSEFDQAKRLWNQAIDQHDPSKAIRAAQHVSEATQYLGQAISQLQKLVQ